MDPTIGQLPASDPAPVEPVKVRSEVSIREQKKVDKQTIIVASIIGALLVALLIGAIIYLAADPARTALIRDITIILTAFGLLLVSLVIGVLLVILIFRVQELISFMRGEVVPMVANIQQTVNTVRGTTTFVSDNVAKPTIKVASFVAGVQQAARAANTRVKSKVGH
jgi:hypothetical protein